MRSRLVCKSTWIDAANEVGSPEVGGREPMTHFHQDWRALFRCLRVDHDLRPDTRDSCVVHKLCSYTVWAKKMNHPPRFNSKISSRSRMARSRPTSPSKAVCASAQSGIASATFFNPDGDSVTSKARPFSERSATTHPEAWSGFRARTKLVRSMISMSANSVILSGPCAFSSPRIENCETDSPAGAKWLSYRRLTWRAL